MFEAFQIKYINRKTNGYHKKHKKYCGEQMMNKEKKIKKLYQDAAYYHLLRQGYHSVGAKVRVRYIYN